MRRMKYLLAVLLATVLGIALARAAVDTPYDQKAFTASQQQGKPILVEVWASWCPTCAAQKPILEKLTADPAFKSPTGSFDRLRFEQLIRNAGYSEQRFIAEQRRVMLRREIIDSLTGALPVPKAWLSAVNQFQNEERSIAYVRLGPAQAGDIPQPTAEELNKYFEARKILFRAPEYRKISTIQVTPLELGKWMDISEAEIKAAPGVGDHGCHQPSKFVRVLVVLQWFRRFGTPRSGAPLQAAGVHGCRLKIRREGTMPCIACGMFDRRAAIPDNPSSPDSDLQWFGSPRAGRVCHSPDPRNPTAAPAQRDAARRPVFPAW